MIQEVQLLHTEGEGLSQRSQKRKGVPVIDYKFSSTETPEYTIALLEKKEWNLGQGYVKLRADTWEPSFEFYVCWKQWTFGSKSKNWRIDIMKYLPYPPCTFKMLPFNFFRWFSP